MDRRRIKENHHGYIFLSQDITIAIVGWLESVVHPFVGLYGNCIVCSAFNHSFVDK